MPGLSSQGGLQKHTELADKEVGGVIDHAAASISTDKLLFNMAWVKVTEVDVDVDTTTITITGLDLDAAKAYMLLYKIRNPLASDVAYRLIFNNDNVNTNYYSQFLLGVGSSVGAGQSNSPQVNYLEVGRSSMAQLLIQRTPEGYTQFIEVISKHSSLIVAEAQLMMNVYMVNANVTRIDFIAETANGIEAGSKFILYKVV